MDRRIVDALQDDFPLVRRPYSCIAERVGISEDECLVRIARLSDNGIIRSITPILESKHLGITSATLVALHVPVERTGEVASIINRYPQVTHNFRRDHYYSLWFTLMGKDPSVVEKTYADILKETGICEDDALNLISVRKYKADVRFPI